MNFIVTHLRDLLALVGLVVVALGALGVLGTCIEWVMHLVLPRLNYDESQEIVIKELSEENTRLRRENEMGLADRLEEAAKDIRQHDAECRGDGKKPPTDPPA